MIAMGIRYLCGYAVASAPASRQRAEWPPHPGRVYIALAAAHFETGADTTERRALEWLEERRAPALRASDALSRSVVSSYVPVNDVEISDALRRRLREAGGRPASDAEVKSGVGVLPEVRPKQPRTFPRVWPLEDTVYLVWEENPPPEVRQGLASLCTKVTRIGHSSSLVHAWVVEPGEEPEPNLVPNEQLGSDRLRVMYGGCLRELESAFGQREFQEYERLRTELEQTRDRQRQAQLRETLKERFPAGRPLSRRPTLGLWQGYARPEVEERGEAVAEGPFDAHLLVLAKTDGATLGLESTLQVTGALRDAVMRAGPQPVPEWISGHTRDGRPTQEPHLAFLPLPYVGYEHADGHLMGVAVAVPRLLKLPSGETREAALRKHLGPLFFNPENGEPREIILWKTGQNEEVCWKWRLERETREAPPHTLRVETWTRPSRLWASVTPVVLHHHPKYRRAGDVERIIREACRTALLAEPEHVWTQPVSGHRGAGHARGMPFFDGKSERLCSYQTHVRLGFAQTVRGPILVGRGRYRGYGLFRPVTEGSDE
jgi:CRISPR-associated protein Csb2